MSLAAQEKTCTIDDIYALPEGERAELIDGQIYYMAPPARKHQRIAGELYATIREYIKSNDGSCEVDIAPFAVFLHERDFNYVEPDISVICDPDKLEGLLWRAGLDYRNRFAEQQTDGLLYQAIQIPHCWRAGILDRGS